MGDFDLIHLSCPLFLQSSLSFFQHILSLGSFPLLLSVLQSFYSHVFMSPSFLSHSLSSYVSGFQKNSNPSLSVLIKQQHSWFRVSLVYWSLTIPLNSSEGWQDLSGCIRVGGWLGWGVTGGLQLGKTTPGGICKHWAFQQRPHYKTSNHPLSIATISSCFLA